MIFNVALFSSLNTVLKYNSYYENCFEYSVFFILIK